MKELVKRILQKKVQEKVRKGIEDERGKVRMLMGIREVRSWRNQNQMGFLVPDIRAGETATGLHGFEKNVRKISKDKTHHCDRSAVRLKNNIPWNLTPLEKRTKCHSQYFHRMAMRRGLHQGVLLLQDIVTNKKHLKRKQRRTIKITSFNIG
jgi:hypothetical protein